VNFECNVCHEGFKSMEELWIHKGQAGHVPIGQTINPKIAKTPKEYPCRICGKIWYSLASQICHENAAHAKRKSHRSGYFVKDGIYRCSHCEFGCKGRAGVLQHIIDNHVPRPQTSTPEREKAISDTLRVLAEQQLRYHPDSTKDIPKMQPSRKSGFLAHKFEFEMTAGERDQFYRKDSRHTIPVETLCISSSKECMLLYQCNRCHALIRVPPSVVEENEDMICLPKPGKCYKDQDGCGTSNERARFTLLGLEERA
jgi:hypothetical protein